ncbi:hypothetical protein Mkiyose1665_49900 [Mycobacterium kiyosense]|nr:hypothetical protein MKCMC460_62030 [Mycobacterium sp. 20KCMC460]GLB92999.1 hypothetical protein SRL2020130_58160 [Mycobacterium kiyosense]GLC04127.1 hypothetical protein SRL2020400_47180 [Mycobacterium kiyosense]GLC11197.1 hypothetical protein SRL2020411_58430 [Mycobacterium kiyosense]GLC17183.1 hypothetical protein SRL2020448_57860 [Mycobacterium kiyosense]
MKKRWHRIALAAATLGGTAGMMIMALPLVSQVSATIDSTALYEMGMLPEAPVVPLKHYGSIAYAPTGEWGKAVRYLTKDQADQHALAVCGVDTCKVLISFRGCGAIAYDGSRYVGGGGYPLSVAQDDAINRLGGGRIVNWACNT